ncbi:ATP-binding protein [Curtobacterium sp. S6]|uniref:ATP-binding protein n=1 Tax=Curtobacterium sp. S6 TaxID=1479623 RepID=UPI0009E88588|nr:ATP-binding protein [Curtobacterium sp. S6]
MRTPQHSPFSPGSDTIPDVWAGRVPELSDWRDVVRPRRLSGTPERGRTILGEPGMGKSSLVRRIARHAEKEGDWVTPQLRIALGADPIKMLATALLRLASQAGLASAREKRVADLMGRVESVSVGPASLGLRPAEGALPHEALRDLLIEIGRAARQRGNTMVLIHLDEIQNIEDDAALSQLLIALGDALVYEEEYEAPGGAFFSEALPLAVYLTGLPEFNERAGASRGATFVRRFRTITLKPLEADDLRLALDPFTRSGWKMLTHDGAVSSIRMAPEARDMIVGMSAGDPFLFQLAGERAWYAGSGDVITADDAARGWETAKGEAEDHVARVLERLAPKEREFIEIMAELDPSDRSMTRIARQAGYAKATTVGPLARRLDEKRGLIVRGKPVYRFRHRAIEAYLTTDWPNLPEGNEPSS